MHTTTISRAVALAALGLAASAQAQVPFPVGGRLPAVSSGQAPAAGGGKPFAVQQMPGYSRAIMAPVTPAESEAAVFGRSAGKLNIGVPRRPATTTGSVSALRVSGDVSATGPASIPELARALRGDPDLIYEYVRNNIEYVPTWGMLKGEFGALLDNQGTAFDQSALMIALLRQSGYSASFVKGRLSLTAAQVRDWLGVDTANICGVLNLFGNAQIPVSQVYATAAGSCPGTTAALHSLKVDHVWVKVNINGTNYYFDPSFKLHTRKAGINVASATGYNAAAFMSGATSGATITSDYVQGINRANLRSSLSTYATNLAAYLRTNLPAGTLDDVIGGMTINPHSGVLRQAVVPNQDTTLALTEWSEVPANYKPTIRIEYQGIDRTFTSDAIYGRRLTLTYNAANQPLLSLDGAVLATGTATAPGAYGNVAMTVTHGAYTSTFANQSFTQQIKAGGTFLIGNGWGPAGRGPVELHRSRLDQALAAGASPTSEAALGSTLGVLSSSWIGQVNHSKYIIDRLARTNTLYHHQIGIAGYNTAAYVDLPGNMVSVVSQDANTAKESAVFFSGAMHSSIFESTAVQQTTGGSAVSTVKLIDMAVVGNQRIYDAKSANFATAVQPNLVGCAGYVASFQSSVNAGRRLILPSRCDLNEGGWTGVGFFDVLVGANGWSLGSIISGGLAGGFSTAPLAPSTTNTNTLFNTLSPYLASPYTGSIFGDPIDMVKGNYLYSQTDLATGVGEFPMSLSFSRSYTSGNRTQNSPLGYGWNSGLMSGVAVRSDGFQGMGEDSALDAVGAIAEKLVSIDLLSDTTKPVTNMVLATLAQRWFGEQITDNTVAVKQGMNAEIFVKLPDGSFNSPPGNAAKLQKSNGTYTYQTLNRALLAYDAAGNLSTYTHPAGIQVKYSYTNGLLTQVANSVGRVLTLGYNGNRISSVSDGARSVAYTYDSSGNLATSADPLSQVTTYQYDLPGRLTRMFYPANPTTAALTNVYDSLGRVQTQSNAHGKLFTYYFAGSRSEEAGPYDQRRVSYLDGNGKVLKSVDPLGRTVTNTYDGQTRLVTATMPEGNRVEYVYDDATCAAQGSCTHNIKTVRHVPKPGSGLPTLTDSFTYESSFNRVASATDPLLKVTNYTYTAQGHPLTVTSPADASGVSPATTYGYTGFTVAGYPTFYLQTSTTSKVSASSSVVSAISYDTANRYVPKTGTLDAVTGGLNLATTYVYDAIGNLTSANGPRTDVNDVSSFTYNANRQPVQQTDALGKLTMQAYDADGRLVRTAMQAGTQWLVSCTSYSVSGKLLKSWGPATVSAHTSCPDAAAPVRVSDYVYDDLDQNTRVVENLPAAEGGNRITDTAYYLDGKVQSVSRGVGGALAQLYARYTYTPNGQLATIADANNNLTTYQYDGHERQVKVQYPDKVTPGVSSATDVEQFVYNNAGNLTSHVKRNGQATTIAYDALGRVVSRSYPDAADNVQFTYDLLSRQTGASYVNGSHVTSSIFDNASRLTSNTMGGRTLSHQYDAAGNRIRTTWPDAGFFVTTDYDVLNRPTAIRELGSAALASYTYDDLSRRTTLQLGNGTVRSYGFDAQGGLGSLGLDLGGAAHDNTWSHTRNQAREIVGTAWTNDLYQWNGFANGTRSYAVNGLNQYTSAAGAAIGYDANGNLSTDGTWTYAYDSDNRLRSANRSGLAASLTYDPLGRLSKTVIGGSTTEILYGGTQLLAEYDGAGTLLRRYVHGHGVDEPLVRYDGAGTAAKSWLYADHLGSIVAEADSTGVAGATHTYGPFGEPGSASGNRFGYTGQFYLGDLGLSYYKARFYSPALGRFLQTDPVGMLDSLNLYAYVGNNPINRNDPTGAIGETVWDVFNLTLGGASLVYNLRNGNYGWAAVDAAGLVYDGVATAVPFLPAGASAGLKAYRGGRSVSQSVAVGADVAQVSKGAHTAAVNASMTARATTEGTKIHRATDAAVDLSSSATSYLKGANGKTGIKPDVVWDNVAGAPGLWADLTTKGQWGAHVRKYGAGFGEGIPILYERGKGVIDTTKLKPGAGFGFGLAEALIEGGK